MIVFTKRVEDGRLYVKIQDWIGNTKTYEDETWVECGFDNAEELAKISLVKDYFRNKSDLEFVNNIINYIPTFDDEEK